MGNGVDVLLCTGLFLCFVFTPSPSLIFDVPDDCLAAGVNVDMLDRDFLLTLAAMLAERAQKRRPSPRQFVRLIEMLAPQQGPIFEHGAAIAPHGGVVGGDQLCGHHAFQLVSGGDAVQRADDGAPVFVFDASTPWVLPQRLHGLIGDQVIPVVGLRAADTFQRVFGSVALVCSCFVMVYSLAVE